MTNAPAPATANRAVETTQKAMTHSAPPRSVCLGELVVVTAAFACGMGLSIATGWFLMGPLTTVACVGLVTWLLARRNSNWAEFGLGRHKWWQVLLFGLVGFFVINVVVTVVAQVFKLQNDTSDLDFMRGNLGMYLLMVGPVAWLAAAFGEEMLFRGFFMNRLAQFLGNGTGAKTASVLLQAVVFGGLHAYQGWHGVLLVSVLATLMGLLYYVSGRNLWACVLVHGLTDTLGLSAIYFELMPSSA